MEQICKSRLSWGYQELGSTQDLPSEIWRKVLAPLAEDDFLAVSRVNHNAYVAGSSLSLLRPRHTLAYPNELIPIDAQTIRQNLFRYQAARQNFMTGKFSRMDLGGSVQRAGCRRNAPRTGRVLRKSTFSADGRRVAILHKSNVVTLWDVAPRALMFGASIRLSCLSDDLILSEDGRHVAVIPSGYFLGSPLRIWDTWAKPVSIVREIQDQVGTLIFAQFTADSRFFISATECESRDGRVLITCLGEASSSDIEVYDSSNYVHSVELSKDTSTLSFVFASEKSYIVDLRSDVTKVRAILPDGANGISLRVAPNGTSYMMSTLVGDIALNHIVPINAAKEEPKWSLSTGRHTMTHPVFFPILGF